MGRDCKIRTYAILDARSGAITLGDSCKVGSFSVLFGEGGITLGDHVSIAPHCVLVAANHEFGDVTRSIQSQGTNGVGIMIESDVWLGAGVKVLDGVTIGRGSVVAAGAVVTKDVAPMSVVGGVPAKVLSLRG